jgi:hypothetical protein
MSCYLPLELSLKDADVHVQVMLVDLLLTGTLGLVLIAFLVQEHSNLVWDSHALDRLGLAHLSPTSPPPPNSSSHPSSLAQVKVSFDAADAIRAKVAH